MKYLSAVLLCVFSTCLYRTSAIYISRKPDDAVDISYRSFDTDERKYDKENYLYQDSPQESTFLAEQQRVDQEHAEDDVDKNPASWGHFDSPWDTPLFRWMEDPLLTHLPLGHRGSHYDSRDADYASHLRGRKRPQAVGEHPDWAGSAQHQPQASGLSQQRVGLSQQRVESDEEGANDDGRRRSQRRGQTHHSRHHGEVGHREQPTRQSRLEENDLVRSFAGLRQHSDPIDERRSNAKVRGVNTNEHSARGEGLRHPQKRSQAGRGSRPDWRHSVRSRTPSPGFGHSISSLPHTADQIVYKLPSETPPHEQSSPTLYASSARRIHPVTRDFVSLSRLSERDGGRRRKNRNRAGHRLTSQRQAPQPRYTRLRGSHEPGTEGFSTARPEHFGRRTGENVTTSQRNVDSSHSNLEDEDWRGRSDGDEVSPGARPVHPYHHAQGHSGRPQNGRSEGDSFCRRQLDTCQKTELEYRRLGKTYQVRNFDKLIIQLHVRWRSVVVVVLLLIAIAIDFIIFFFIVVRLLFFSPTLDCIRAEMFSLFLRGVFVCLLAFIKFQPFCCCCCLKNMQLHSIQLHLTFLFPCLYCLTRVIVSGP